MSKAHFLPQEIIRAKRDGLRLAPEDIERFVEGLTDGSVSEGQAAAFAMAVFLKGLALDERVALTRAMMASGEVLRWDLPGPVLDKHSTGGVGDNVSLILAPAVAACGGYVPMISGRGLGHTGGTLDKLEAIPTTGRSPTSTTSAAPCANVGCAIIGQTADLAPADKRLYAIRDVTGDGRIDRPHHRLDPVEEARRRTRRPRARRQNRARAPSWQISTAASALARSLVQVANGAGLPTTALITDMGEPLADAAGNALETHHAIDHLTGARRQDRVHEIVARARRRDAGDRRPRLGSRRGQGQDRRGARERSRRRAVRPDGRGARRADDLMERPAVISTPRP